MIEIPEQILIKFSTIKTIPDRNLILKTNSSISRPQSLEDEAIHASTYNNKKKI